MLFCDAVRDTWSFVVKWTKRIEKKKEKNNNNIVTTTINVCKKTKHDSRKLCDNVSIYISNGMHRIESEEKRNTHTASSTFFEQKLAAVRLNL